MFWERCFSISMRCFSMASWMFFNYCEIFFNQYDMLFNGDSRRCFQWHIGYFSIILRFFQIVWDVFQWQAGCFSISVRCFSISTRSFQWHIGYFQLFCDIFNKYDMFFDGKLDVFQLVWEPNRGFSTASLLLMKRRKKISARYRERCSNIFKKDRIMLI